jgi:hypothetical protein
MDVEHEERHRKCKYAVAERGQPLEGAARDPVIGHLIGARAAAVRLAAQARKEALNSNRRFSQQARRHACLLRSLPIQRPLPRLQSKVRSGKADAYLTDAPRKYYVENGTADAVAVIDDGELGR